MTKNISKISEALIKFSNKKVLVIGDIMIDHFVYGNVSRISPEAPVPILKKTDEVYVPGGAANVANNLSSLGAKVILAGSAGDDHAFEVLKKLLSLAKIDYSSIIVSKKKPTIQKERLISKYQHMVRLDTEDISNLTPTEEKELFGLIEKKIKNCDGIILSDYAKGCFSKALTQLIIKHAKKINKPIFADLKPTNREYFKGVDVITPNFKEALEMTGEKDISSAGKSLVKYYKTDVIVTKGGEGVSVFRKDGKHIEIPVRQVSLVDVSGAGDTFIAVECLGLICGLDIVDAVSIASVAGATVVQKPGTSTLTLEELESAIEGENDIEALSVIKKVWGHEKWLENNDKYCCKLLSLNKGYQCSLHYHKNKDEMFFVTKGHVRLESDGKITHLRAGSFQRIPPGTKHRFRGIEDSIIIEVSTRHEESDSYRIEVARKAD